MKLTSKSVEIEYDDSAIIPIRMVKCIICKHKKKYFAKNMCSLCYAAVRSNKKRKCLILFFNMQYPEIGKNYRHYKGGLYKVLTLAKHSEIEEVLVIYRSVHFGSVHARPLNMWFQKIKGIGNRFKLEKKLK